MNLILDSEQTRGGNAEKRLGHNIPVAAPFLIGNEKRYVNECMESGWISSAGSYVKLFEKKFAELCGVKHAIACCNGTVALHLALMALGVGDKDEVIVPTLTFVATANAVTYCGATPVFVDSETDTWNLNPADVAAKITSRTKGIIAVHLYGHPAKMRELKEIARRNKLFLLEDAAEAHGALCDGQTIGSLGDMAAFSFYANKIITTGEGGMVVTDDDNLAQQARLLRGQGLDGGKPYWHTVIGYNYRMMNLPAAIGCAQIEKLDDHIDLRHKVASHYQKRLHNIKGLSWQEEQRWARHVYWMFNVILNQDSWQKRDDVIRHLQENGIETRPVFYPMHQLPIYENTSTGEKFPVAEHIALNGISLPTWAGLKTDEIDYVCDVLLQCRLL